VYHTRPQDITLAFIIIFTTVLNITPTLLNYLGIIKEKVQNPFKGESDNGLPSASTHDNLAKRTLQNTRLVKLLWGLAHQLLLSRTRLLRQQIIFLI
jgi:hypothetical protein